MRRLLVVRRSVPVAERSAYDAAWRTMRAAATDHGAHAWRFRAADGSDRYLEFIEYKAGADPRDAESFRAAARSIERLAPAEGRELWDDANLT